MTQPQPRRISSRGKYVGMLETNDGLVIYFRMEHHVPGRGYIANGPVLSLVLSDDQVVGEAWYQALSSASSRAMHRLITTPEPADTALPGIG